jgi:membrane carboxypeptidase/penicillin-binding protein PbpC
MTQDREIILQTEPYLATHGPRSPCTGAFESGRALAASVALALTLRLWPHAPLSSYAPLSTAVYAEDGQLLRLTLASDQQYRLWTPLSDVSPEFVDALLLHEDRHFRWHVGVDPVALVRACARMATGGPHQGGSTITIRRQHPAFYVRSSPPSTPLAWAPTQTGDVDLSVVDDHGDTTARNIRVAVIP